MTQKRSPRRRGRPKLAGKMVRRPIMLTLRSGKDDDLIEWFSNIPSRQRARYIERALRMSCTTDFDDSSSDDSSDYGTLINLLNLRESVDSDLLGWLGSIPTGEHARYIKTALRQGGATFKEELSQDEAEELIDNNFFDDLLDGF